MNRYLLASHLLSYPTEELISELEPTSPLTVWLKEQDIFTVQEHYVEVFDRSVRCSLYLFEHIHAESKERGKALISLREMYTKEGCTLGTKELPDYLPLFLEFLSMVSEEKALEFLENVSHILSRIASTLKKRGSPYHEIIASLVVGSPEEIEEKPEPDIDKIWEEEPVQFNSKGCGT